MAEPLGLAASLIAVAQISGTIISLCYDYRKGLKGAQKDIVQILRETQSLRNVVEQLIPMVDNTGSEVDQPSFKNLSLNDGLLTQFQDDLKKLENRLRTPVNKWQRLGEQLLWPLRERDVKQALDTIHRMKSIVEFGLVVDTSTGIVEIKKNTREIMDRIANFQSSIKHLSEQEAEQETLRLALDWLRAPNPLIRHNDVYRKRMRNTGQWLLDMKEFQEWSDAKTSIFWLNGIPGCGKSVLCSIVIEHIRHHCARPANSALAYFYFDFSNDTTSKPENMLRSLISQLSAWKGKPLMPLLKSAHSHLFPEWDDWFVPNYRDGVLEPSIKCLVKVLQGIIEENGSTYLVLDALDECPDQIELFDILNEFLANQKDGLHIFMSSRRTAEIVSYLQSNVTYDVAIHTDDVDHDIDNFVQDQLRVHPKLRKWPEGLRKEIHDRLVKGASGMFRWVDCHIEMLAKCVTVRDVRKALQTLPKSLSETYALTINGIDEHHWQYAVRILLWLAISSKPLELNEAAEILAIDLDSEDGPLFEEDLKIPDPNEIPIMCASLVSVHTVCLKMPDGNMETTVELRLAHYTVREYMLSEMFFSNFQSKLPVTDQTGVHALAAKISLAYLLSMESDEIPKDRPFSRRAAEFWLLHYSKAPNDLDVERLALRLLREDGQTGTYRNWCKLFDPNKPWKDPDFQRSTFPAPIYYACSEGVEPLVRALLKAGANRNTRGELHETCLQAAACNGHVQVVSLLLEAGADVNISGGVQGSPIVAASSSGHPKVVELLLKYGADPNGKDYFSLQGSALIAACQQNYEDVVQILMAAGADPNQHFPKRKYCDAISTASGLGHKECLALMLPSATRSTALCGLSHVYEARADRDVLRLYAKFFPDATIKYAAALEYEDIVLDLLEKNVSSERDLEDRPIGQKSEDQKPIDSALFEACAKGHFSIAKRLIDSGANVNSKSTTIKSYPLTSAAESGNVELVKLLLTHGADTSLSGFNGPALHIAANKGHREIFQMLKAHDASLADNSEPYGDALHAAVAGGHIDIVKDLLSAGMDVNKLKRSYGWPQYDVGDSSIQTAVAGSDLAMVKLLLEHGANPNLYNPESKQLRREMKYPLSIAARNGDLDLVNVLLDAGADANHVDERRGHGSPLILAVEAKSLIVVNRLLDAGADPNVIFQQPMAHTVTVLALACLEKDEMIVEALLKSGADINKGSEFWKVDEDNEYETIEPPIHTAARTSTAGVVRVLVKYGADVNAQSHDGATPLHKAVRVDNSEVVQALLTELRADISLSLGNGSLPIHSAASNNRIESMKLLVQAGSDINSRNGTGRTPLHWAADSGAGKAVEWLLENAADDTILEDGTNMTARDYAELRLLWARDWQKRTLAEIVQTFDRYSAKPKSKIL